MLEKGIIYGVIAGAGAVWRAYKGYQSHMKDNKTYENFSWRKFLITTIPAFAAGFVVGAALGEFPSVLSTEGIVLSMMLFTGGAGVGSLQGKLPFKK